jgi:ribosomal-protein-alanine N-acetyltransferase
MGMGRASSESSEQSAPLLVPEHVATARLELRRPVPEDAEAIFRRYASVPEVTRYLSWPTHRTVGDSQAFLEASNRSWADTGVGPYLVWTGQGTLVGGTGLALETPERAETGYVFAADAWGLGYATEVTRCMASLAFTIPSLVRLYAICHADNAASQRVLEKAGFLREERVHPPEVFPNSGWPEPVPAWVYVRTRASAGSPPRV